MTKSFNFCLIFTLLFFTWSVSGNQKGKHDNRVISLKQLKTHLSNLPGWHVTAPIEHYSADKLFHAINGGASLYIQYHNQGLTMLQLSNGKGDTAGLELYRQRDALSAYGVLTRQHPDYLKESPATRHLCNYGDNTAFTAGSFFGKIYPSSKASITALNNLAKHLQDKLEPMPDHLEAFSVFPSAGLLKGSFGYIPAGHLGFKYLTDMLKADYKPDADSLATFFLRAKFAAGQPDSIFSTIEKAWRKAKSLTWEQADSTGRWMFMSDPFQGNTAICLKKNLLAGVTSGLSREATLTHLDRFLQHCLNFNN